jgi:hypothetical protein
VTGLTHLFAGASLSVAMMAGSLEFSKFIVVGFVYRYWGHIHKPLRAYLMFSIAVLMVITSVGIYGYLSAAYQVASMDIHSSMMEIDALEKQNKNVESQILDMKQFITDIPASRISRKYEFQKVYLPKIEELNQKSLTIVAEIEKKKHGMLKKNVDVGPIVYLAQALGTDIDSAVKYFILIFVSVFDPLAVSLVFCLNLLIRLREKYRNDEFKIGARSLTSPVDHRLKKVA